MAKKKKEEGAQFVRYFGPLLDALRGLGGSGMPDEVVERIAQDLALSDEIQNELLPSGESRYRKQVEWARFYLVREGLLDSSKRGVWSLTERGRSTTLMPEQSREVFLKWDRIFQEQRRSKAKAPEPVAEEVAEGTGATPNDYRSEVINLLFNLPPSSFERLVQRLLREAGFTQVVVTGSSRGSVRCAHVCPAARLFSRAWRMLQSFRLHVAESPMVRLSTARRQSLSDSALPGECRGNPMWLPWSGDWPETPCSFFDIQPLSEL